jgi:acyl-lipid omega-3 desaturase
MPPCVVDPNTKSGKEAIKALNLASMRKVIPEEAFVKSLPTSLMYMVRDYAGWGGALYGILALNHSAMWETMPFWQRALATLVFWNIAGFFMWCIFVVGHDCGHTNFSEYPVLNDIVGSITHGSILVPYFPWQVMFSNYRSFRSCTCTNV